MVLQYIKNFAIDEDIANLKLKYLFNWDDFKKKYPLTPDATRANFERFDKEIFDQYMLMLIYQDKEGAFHGEGPSLLC